MVRGIGDNGVAIVGIVVVAGVAVRVHLEEIVVVVRVGRTLPPIVVVSTKRSGTGNGVTIVLDMADFVQLYFRLAPKNSL